jgi:hypothetical protein
MTADNIATAFAVFVALFITALAWWSDHERERAYRELHGHPKVAAIRHQKVAERRPPEEKPNAR